MHTSPRRILTVKTVTNKDICTFATDMDNRFSKDIFESRTKEWGQKPPK